MTHDEMIVVIQAHKEGKQLQARMSNTDWHSYPVGYPFVFNFSLWEYRIKPQPKEVWVATGIRSGINYIVEDIEAVDSSILTKPVRYREVIEE